MNDKIDNILLSTSESPPVQPKNRQQTAGVLLAAGGSRRLGIPKQTILWNGKPLVRHVAEIGLNAGLDPLFVITGCYKDLVVLCLAGMKVTILFNENWQDGQGSSIACGVNNFGDSVKSAIFLLCDQPFVSETLIRTLIEQWIQTRFPIIVPFSGGRRANPGLFDRITFADLSNLKGDSGGRTLFSRFPVKEVPWVDERILVDVDTEDDIKLLKNYE